MENYSLWESTTEIIAGIHDLSNGMQELKEKKRSEKSTPGAFASRAKNTLVHKMTCALSLLQGNFKDTMKNELEALVNFISIF